MNKQKHVVSKWLGRLPLCLFISIASLLVACGEDDDQVKEVKEPFTMEVDIPAAGETETITVEALDNWSLSTNNSAMVEILSPKVGSKGNVKIEFKVSQNTSFAIRKAELNFNDGRQNIIKITQNANTPSMTFDRPVSVAYDADSKLFQDRIEVTSNIAWTIPGELPEWIEEVKIVGDKTPQESVMTKITLQVIAKQDYLKAAGNSDQIVLADAKDNAFPLAVSFAGFTPQITFNKEELVLEIDNLNNLRYKGHLTVTSNVKWQVDNSNTAWIKEFDVTAGGENGVQTETSMWMYFPAKDIDTDGLNGKLAFKDVLGDYVCQINALVPAPGNGVLVVEADKISMHDDHMFDAQEADGARMSGLITVYANDHTAYQPVLLVNDLRTGKIVEQTWPRIGEIAEVPATRSALSTKTWELIVYNRNEYEPNSAGYEERSGVAVFLPNTMFDEYGAIKEEYLNEDFSVKEEVVAQGIFFRQKGITLPDPYLVLDGVDNGGSISYDAKSGEYMLYIADTNLNLYSDRDGIAWTAFENGWFEMDLDPEKSAFKLRLKANTTGQDRKEKITIWHANTEKTLVEFMLTQKAD